MSQAPVELIVAAFQTEDGAENALKELQAARKAQWISLANAAVLRRDTSDKLHIKETADRGFGRGAVVGGILGAVASILFPPTLLAGAAIGAALGGVTAKVMDGGFSDARLRELGRSLHPGTSAIVAVIEHKWVEDVVKGLAEEGAQVVVEALKADIAKQLQAGRDLSISAVASDEALTVNRAAVGEDGADVSTVVVTEDGVTGATLTVSVGQVEAQTPVGQQLESGAQASAAE